MAGPCAGMAGPCAGIAAACAPVTAAARTGDFISVSSQIAGIDAARDAGVCCAFYDRAAVRENRDLVLAVIESQREFVRAHLAEAGEPGGKLGQIERALTFVDLHGVPSTKTHRSAAAVIQINKLASTACGAFGIPGRHGNFTQWAGP